MNKKPIALTEPKGKLTIRQTLIRILDESDIAGKCFLCLSDKFEFRVFPAKSRGFDEIRLKIGIFKENQYTSFGFEQPINLKEHLNEIVAAPIELLLEADEENRDNIFLNCLYRYLNTERSESGRRLTMTIPSLKISSEDQFVSVVFKIGTYEGFAKIPLQILAPFLSSTSKAILSLANLTFEEVEEEDLFEDTPDAYSPKP
jgi:hypothetical protein